MTTPDDLFRGYLTEAGPLAQSVRQRILADVRGGRTRRRPGRAVVAVAAVAAAALATTVATVHRTGSGTHASSDRPRVTWGLEATLQVVPDAGVPLDAAVDRVVAAIRNRARSQDVPGLLIRRTGTDRLAVRIPGATDGDVVSRSVTGFQSLAIFDRSAGRVATFTTFAEMTARFGRMTRPSGYLLMPRSTVGFTGFDWVATHAEAAKRLTFLNATVRRDPERQWMAVPTPAGPYRLVTIDRGARMDVVRDASLVSALDIVGARADEGGALILTLTASAQRRIAPVLARHDAVLVSRWAGPYATGLTRIARMADGRLRVETLMDGLPADIIIRQLGSPAVPAQALITSTQPYGTRPPLTGEHVATLPPEVLRSVRRQFDPRGSGIETLRIPPESVLRVVTTTNHDQTASLFVARTPAGDDIVYPTLGIGGGNVCVAPPGPPSLATCSVGLSAGGGGPVVIFGRVGDPAIRSIAVRYPDATYPGSVDNGWFIALVPGRSGSSAFESVDGLDDRSRVVARIDPRGRIIRP